MWQTKLEHAYETYHRAGELLETNLQMQRSLQEKEDRILAVIDKARAEIDRLEAMTPEEAFDE